MNAEVLAALVRIRPVFEFDLRESVECVVQESNPYGYALVLGEDIDQASPVAVTNSETALQELSGLSLKEARYFPDEWKDWHGSHFSRFKVAFARAYETLKAHHAVTYPDFRYTPQALEFMKYFYDLYLESIKSARLDHPSISFWVIWIPDSGCEIIKRSFFELNSGKAVEEAGDWYREI